MERFTILMPKDFGLAGQNYGIGLSELDEYRWREEKTMWVQFES